LAASPPAFTERPIVLVRELLVQSQRDGYDTVARVARGAVDEGQRDGACVSEAVAFLAG
jgi:hypothetical protein